MAERGRPAAADKECPALVAGLPGGKFTNSAVCRT
nr:hypothetical protein [Escherichia coli]